MFMQWSATHAIKENELLRQRHVYTSKPCTYENKPETKEYMLYNFMATLVYGDGNQKRSPMKCGVELEYAAKKLSLLTDIFHVFMVTSLKHMWLCDDDDTSKYFCYTS